MKNDIEIDNLDVFGFLNIKVANTLIFSKRRGS